MADFIDVSVYQGSMNFRKTKESGIKGVVLRGAYSIYQDRKFQEFYQNAVSCGYTPGVYLFTISHYESESGNFNKAKKVLSQEISALLSTLVGKKTDFIALDFEMEQNEKNCLSKSEMTELANFFAEKIRASGHTPRIYCSIAWLFDYMLPDEISCDFWIAYYYEDAQKNEFPPTKWGDLMNKVKNRIKLWQYSDTGYGPEYGSSSPTIDLNYNYSEIPAPTPETEPKPIPPQPQFKVGEKVILNGYLYGDSFGGNIGQYRAGTTNTITRIVDTNRTSPYLLDDGLGWVKGSEIKPANNNSASLNKGDIVIVKKGATTFSGGGLADWVNNQETKFWVLEQPVGNRVVIGNQKGEVTAAMRLEDLIKVS